MPENGFILTRISRIKRKSNILRVKRELYSGIFYANTSFYVDLLILQEGYEFSVITFSKYYKSKEVAVFTTLLKHIFETKVN